MSTAVVTRRGTSNTNDRGSTASRRARRAWIVLAYESNILGFCRCYRCGVLLYNPDTVTTIEGLPQFDREVIMTYGTQVWTAKPLTIDRIIPGCKGGTYRRNNIRPACGTCNFSTGGALGHT